MAGKFPAFRSASCCPCFHVTCSHHFSRALIADMQNFVPRIPPADPVWSSNHASDHTSKVDIKFDHICIVDASGPSSQTSDWCHDGIEEFQFVSDSAQTNPFVGKKRRDSQTANGNQYPELHFWNRLQTTYNPTICDPLPSPVP